MYGFKFKYENIINVKEKIEEAAKSNLATAQNDLESENSKLSNLMDKKANHIGSMANKIETGTNVTFLKQQYLYINSLNSKIKLKKNHISKCEEVVVEKRNELIKAVKERKIMEKFKEKEQEKHIDEQKRKEIMLVDELVTYKNYKTS